MSTLNDKIKTGVEKMNYYTDVMNQGVDQVNEFVNYVDKAKKFKRYWSSENEKNRIELQKQVEQWKQKESAMVKHYFILWVCMIILTIVLCIIFI